MESSFVINLTTPSVTALMEHSSSQLEWYVAEVINSMAIFIVLWVGISLILFGVRTKKWQNGQANQLNAGNFYTSAVVAIFSPLLRLAADQAVFNLRSSKYYSALLCEIVSDLTVAGYVISATCTYIFLWFRQHTLYQHPSMQQLRKRWLVNLSRFSFAFIICACVVTGVAFIWPMNYSKSLYGCKMKPRKSLTVWPLYMGNGIGMVGQSLLMFLFLHPLRSASTRSIAVRIKAIIKRSSVCAVLTVFSDLISMVSLAFVVPDDATTHVTTTIYEINCLINIFSVLLSFEAWKSIVFTPFEVLNQRLETTFVLKQRIQSKK